MNSGIQITDAFLKNKRNLFNIAVSVSPVCGNGYNNLSKNVNVATDFQ